MSKPDKHMKKGEYERELQRRKRKLRRRYMRIHIIIFCVMMAVFAVVCFHIFSKKKSIRSEALTLYQEGNYEEALAKFQDAYAVKQWFSDSINVDILLYEADCMLRLQLFPDAEEVYHTITSEYSSYDEEQLAYLTDLAHALSNYQQGDYVSTVATFTKAVEEGHADVSIYAAICYEHQKSYDKMKQYLDIYAAYHGTDAYVSYKYASYCYDTGDYAQALTYLTAAQSYGDTEYLKEILYAQIMCYREQQDYAQAYNLAADFVAKYPEDADGQNLYAYLDTRVNLNEVPVNDKFHLFTPEEGTEATGTDAETHAVDPSAQQ